MIDFLIFSARIRFMMKKRVLIYRDAGCADLTCLEKALRNFDGSVVEFTDSAAILRDDILQSGVDLFVMPGGAATPFLQKLQTLGNQKIRDYVADGGNYLGICAGAYYACAKVLFEKDIPALSVECTDGLLNLVPAVAEGSLYKELKISPYAKNETSSAAVRLCWEDNEEHYSHYHGGPKFCGNTEDFEVLARYADVDGNPPAIINKKVGKGMVVLSGVHFEDSGADLARVFSVLRYQGSAIREVAGKLQKHDVARQALFCKIMNKFTK